jgi:hypothetical protein
LELEVELQETEAPVAETTPVAAIQTGGSSPWDPLFNPELFLERMVDMAGNSTHINSTSTDELLRMSLGHELKGLLLNYALETRQKSEVAMAKEKVALVDKNLASIEQDLTTTKEKLHGEMDTLKAGYEEEVSKLTKAHKEELAKAKEDHAAALKTSKVIREELTAKEGRLATLAKDNEAALSELASLR